ncbi:hypothetical protein NA78x_003023 [Anatilimnocola sp. NA78]|uniref:hypothetical protein n=1 Tax=Anatilimnocola sp. NA78 TaxID=3415683 RepID=UPI003CE46D13
MSHEYDILHTRGKKLEDAYFAERDRRLVEEMKRTMNLEEWRANFGHGLGITDSPALQAIAKVDNGVEVAAATVLLPLVEVAWCDGEVSAQEKAAVLKAANGLGIAVDSPMYLLLQNWLDHRPARAAVEAWKEFVKQLSSSLTPENAVKLKDGIMHRAEKVALTTGGFLGFGNKVSQAEHDCLAELTQAFDSATHA